MDAKEIIVLPNHLYMTEFVKGLRQPIEDVAEILDEQGRPNHALSLREAALICETFAKVCLEKSHELYVGHLQKTEHVTNQTRL